MVTVCARAANSNVPWMNVFAVYQCANSIEPKPGDSSSTPLLTPEAGWMRTEPSLSATVMLLSVLPPVKPLRNAKCTLARCASALTGLDTVTGTEQQAGTSLSEHEPELATVQPVDAPEPDAVARTTGRGQQRGRLTAGERAAPRVVVTFMLSSLPEQGLPRQGWHAHRALHPESRDSLGGSAATPARPARAGCASATP
jgi:hypothetical protein